MGEGGVEGERYRVLPLFWFVDVNTTGLCAHNRSKANIHDANGETFGSTQ